MQTRLRLSSCMHTEFDRLPVKGLMVTWNGSAYTYTVACVAYEAHDRTIHFTPEEGGWEAPQTSMSHSKAMS